MEKDKYTDKAAQHRRHTQIAAETEARLAADPAVQEWLKQFAQDGSGLLARYADDKATALVHGPGWLEDEEFLTTWPYQQAYRRLWEIQQKKLFNLQCLWRAGQVELPEVTDGHEFEKWGKSIHTCPVLDPIEEDDVELYRRYLRSDDCQDLGALAVGTTGWQHYREFRAWLRLDDAGSTSPGHDMVNPDLPDGLIEPLGHLFNMFYCYPDWYAFYDLYRGTGPLLRLPDVRGPYAEPDDDEDDATATPPDPAAPPLRYLSPHDLELTETLLKRFDSPELLRYMRVIEHREEEDSLTRRARASYNCLKDLTEPVPVAAGPDWRQCLEDAYVAYQRRTLSAALGPVFDDYCLREQAGIAHPDPKAF